MILDDRADPLIFCTPLLAESGNWLEGGRRWFALWRVSQSSGLVHPTLWTLVLSWRSSIYPSSLSSSACPMPCILLRFPVSVGWLVSSCWSCLLAMLLSSRSSLSCWSLVWRRLSFCSSLSHLSCWSLGRCSFLWFNCCSNSWLRWVSRSTVVVRVYTCLSMALEGFSVSWLMVAINRVWTMLLFFLETVIWLITRFPTDGANWWCTKIINKLIVHTHVNRVLEE